MPVGIEKEIYWCTDEYLLNATQKERNRTKKIQTGA
jgi:hypothetical protein